MSNPLATFRKNQNYWMAGLVLLAVLAFVVAPALDTASRAFQGGDGNSELVVRWNGGRITVGDLEVSQARHGGLVRFLDALARKVIEKGGQPRVPGFGYDPQSGQITGLGIQGTGNELSICRTKILAAQAKKLGIQFDDATVDQFLNEFCDDRITTQELKETLEEASSGRLSNFDVRQILKEELSAMVVGQLARSGVYSIPPGEIWGDFLKLNQAAKVEAFPLFVDDYISEVKAEPTEAELQAIYEAGMMIPSSANSAQPGFLRRYQANVEYVEASLEVWTEREKEKLTEEQLRAEYDRRVELKQLQVPVEQEPPTETENPAETETSGKTGAESEAAMPAAEPPAAAKSEARSEAGTEASTEAELKVGEDASAEAETATETPAKEPAKETEPPAETEQAESEPPAETEPPAEGPGEGDQSRVVYSPVQLVAFTQQELGGTPPPVVQPPAPETGAAATTPENETPATSQEPPTQQPPAEEASAEAAPPAAQESETPPSVSTEAEAETITETEGEPATEGEIATAEPMVPDVRTQTFEEAREMIADSLARDAAIPLLDEALTSLLEDVMLPYQQKFARYQAFQKNGVDAGDEEPPVKPDLKKEAESRGLKYGTTGLVDGSQIAETQFGLSSLRQDASGITGSVANTIFTQQIALTVPKQSSYFDQAALMRGEDPEFTQYMFWKIEEKAAYIPEMIEVREEVVEAWKRTQALELAKQAAKKLADQVAGTGEDAWGSALSTAEQSILVETDPFTWISRMGEFSMSSQVPKLDEVGEEFMAEVFSTPVSESGFAPNQPQNKVYVFRVVELSPPVEDLQQRFNADPLKSGPMNLANRERQGMVMSWYENLENELGVEWQMPLNPSF